MTIREEVAALRAEAVRLIEADVTRLKSMNGPIG